MNRADAIYMAGYNAALDAAEAAGVSILQSTWGHPVRREHAAAGLCAFVDEARAAMAAEGMVITTMPEGHAVAASPLSAPNSVGPDAVALVVTAAAATEFAGAPKADRAIARAAGYSGDACDTCGSLSMKRVGSCLTCDACGTTTGCS